MKRVGLENMEKRLNDCMDILCMGDYKELLSSPFLLIELWSNNSSTVFIFTLSEDIHNTL